ncbi:hypothetical protein EJ08DRAFT_611127 [Tothia fuscella]|uniref:Uncharacterized protein n=1 Tax=Tothia fuscella TaxID=1048955 RepID=A0A9P4NU05_9PEZI|nr:hypothetical protein EJ08DRAFT_611127 [Tothia fuscella]
MSTKDPTLFTQTGPHASAKPMPPRGTTIPIGGPAPPNETPQQKVARLREAARRSKIAQESTWDKVVMRGRVVADFAHRATTLSLIGFTAVAGVVVAISLGDMMVHNRRKRNEWFNVQQELHRRDLEAANLALAAGTANEDQMLLINRERAREEAEREKLAKKGVFARAKDALFQGMDKEEVPGGTLGVVPVASRESRQGNTGEGVLKAVEDTVRQGKEKLREEKERLSTATEAWDSKHARPVVGGQLDQMGEKTAIAVSGSTKSWTDWALRR